MISFLSRRSVTVEIAVDDPRGVMIAARGGAHRCELSVAREQGGLTPSFGVMQQAARSVDYMVSSGGAQQPNFGVHALIRPRFGGFVYRDDELSVMAADIENAMRLGLSGVKFGVLNPDSQLDIPALRSLIKVARESSDRPKPASLTFHRAIDLVPDIDLLRTLDVLQELGFTRVMTSGGAQSAYDGVKRIARMVKHCRGKLEVQVVGQLKPETFGEVITATGASSVQVSGASLAKMFTPLFGDHDVTNAEIVSRAMQAASNL